MDQISHFRRESAAFEQAIRRSAEAEAAPLVPSCPDWSAADLVLHLGAVHRLVSQVITERSAVPPQPDQRAAHIPADAVGWPSPDPAEQPFRGPVAPGLADWFAAGAAELAEVFATTPLDTEVWTYGNDRTVAFWLRVQCIELSLHRWDAERALGEPGGPIAADIATDAITQNFEVMAPARRMMKQAPPGAGERYRFRRTDGPESWSVEFTGNEVRLARPAGEAEAELAGTASDLLLHLWGRSPAEELAVSGDKALLERYFTLVPHV
ncbi:maleylpyruvate isomerase family mycothiol-dependent enzyme [Kitasatospora acidiphila]|uniref:Maleylpyruvate isomerase family mycothiol-dependent enzyme n=1 Tax=Kitasatospora acidiphila TaxID=2567942 RepID=A0A540WAR8_9ACTN|nr:maleylpyruvate isomerase family mycothiol-dependent enzyme [Kitasatospora acidiphila]TQF06141.1 maleylpyruvate isomerase family mycothiol-dependent enzyme [Kitasatospora acidiphila]